MRHILSVDLEEWYQLACRRISGYLPPPRDTLRRQMDSLLAILDETGTKATFYVLGLAAQAFPDVIKHVASLGHEIASHGFHHRLITSQTRQEFHDDLAQSRALLQDLTGEQVSGYRAPEFSIRRESLWALEVLAELGFSYDSSIFPVRHRRYGIPEFARKPALYQLNNGLTIFELPPAAMRLGGNNLPVAGGGYFRLLPLGMLRHAMHTLERDGMPFVTYFHPYEFDHERLDIFRVLKTPGFGLTLKAKWFNFLQNLRRETLPVKISVLLKEFSFTTSREFLREAQLSTPTELLVAQESR